MTEQSVRFNSKEFEAYLTLLFMDEDSNQFEAEIPFSCGADLQEYMKFFFNKEWNELLPEHLKHVRVVDCEIEGVGFKGEKKEGRFSIHLDNGYQRATFIFNENLLLDKSAEKLELIRKIIDIGDEISLELYQNQLVIRPIREGFDDFSEEILADLIEEGYSGADLMAEFKNRKTQLGNAVDSLIAETMAEGKITTVTDLFGEDD